MTGDRDDVGVLVNIIGHGGVVVVFVRSERSLRKRDIGRLQSVSDLVAIASSWFTQILSNP